MKGFPSPLYRVSQNQTRFSIPPVGLVHQYSRQRHACAVGHMETVAGFPHAAAPSGSSHQDHRGEGLERLRRA